MAAAPNGPRNPVGALGVTATYEGLSSLGFGYVLLLLFLLRSSYGHLFRRSRPMTKGRCRAMAISMVLFPIFCSRMDWLLAPFKGAGDGKIFIDGPGGWYGHIAYNYLFLAAVGRTGTAIALAVPLFFSLWCVFTRQNSLGEAIERRLEQIGGFFLWLLRRLSPLALLRLCRRKSDAATAPAVQPPSVAAERHGGGEERDEGVDDALLAMKKLPVRQSLFAFGGGEGPTEPYAFPPMHILDAPAAGDGDAVPRDVIGAELREALQQFGVEVEIGEIQSGPTITRFEIHPAPGVRVEKIESLDKNIALALSAPSVRILAPVPGKNCVGVEVPNAEASPVCLREILESDEWRQKTAEIPIVLGRGVTGEPLIADLARMPHLLIAGATGSGKTVCINSILASFLFHASPDDIRLILVDPKIVEMQIYNRLPHMLLPTITDPKKVPNALQWLVSNMEWRYQLFASVGVRNIAGFNAKVTRTREEMERAKLLEKELSPEERAAMASVRSGRKESAPMPQQKLPYIVCVIDELADLMIVAPDDVESYIARLAQLARAAGIHLIIATQRPSVNVITGVIKANLPSRIAFKVASKVDSRTILDANGADSLLGHGDMLFLPPGSSALLRAQGAWVSDDEIGRIVDFLAKGGQPKFDSQAMAFVENPDEVEGSPKK
jgi:hypothetical protein